VKEILVNLAKQYAFNPLEFTEKIFPWGEGELKDFSIQNWQKDILKELSVKSEKPIKIAVSSGNGAGKTTLICFLIFWFLSTRTRPKITVTSARFSQLLSTTWRELKIWKERCKIGDFFEYRPESIFLKNHQYNWSANAKSWNISNPQSFAGEHAKNMMILFDEASGIPDIIWDVSRGAMTTKGSCYFIAFSNPTKRYGRFYECFSKKNSWITKKVDISTCDKNIINPEIIKEWKEEWGEDSDDYKIHVKGEFPDSSFNQLISTNYIESLINTHPNEFSRDDSFAINSNAKTPVKIGVDVATGEAKDYSTIVVRRKNIILEIIREKLRLNDFLQLITDVLKRYKTNTLAIDSIGVSCGLVQDLENLGYQVIKICGSETAIDKNRFINKRAELYFKLKNWIQNVGFVGISNNIKKEHIRILQEELLSIEYSLDDRDKNRYRILPKKEKSPDIADGLTYTFGYENSGLTYGRGRLGVQRRYYEKAFNY
jgi:hypothetical protein